MPGNTILAIDQATASTMALRVNSDRRVMARAVIESIAYQVRDVFEVMQTESGGVLSTLLADGGATRNDLLMQFQADVLGCPVIRSESPDVSALGAAYLAGLTVGLWNSEAEIAALRRERRQFDPQCSSAHRDSLYAGWRDAVARTLFKPAQIPVKDPR